MSNNQKIWGPANTVKITATTLHAAGDLVNEDNLFGVCEEVIADTKQGMINTRGVFELTKATPADVLAVGTIVEFVSGGTVRAYSKGSKIGKVYEASGASDATVLAELMPELY